MSYEPNRQQMRRPCCANCARGLPCLGDSSFTGWAWTMGIILAGILALPAVLKK